MGPRRLDGSIDTGEESPKIQLLDMAGFNNRWERNVTHRKKERAILLGQRGDGKLRQIARQPSPFIKCRKIFRTTTVSPILCKTARKQDMGRTCSLCFTIAIAIAISILGDLILLYYPV